MSQVAPDNNASHIITINYGFSTEELNELRENFQKFDINNDGDIDIHELAEIMRILGDYSS